MTNTMMSRTDASARALVALEGLSVGDAFGETNLARTADVLERVRDRRIRPARPWCWTDDTAMALAIVDTLDAHGEVDEAALAAAFATRYAAEPARGYGTGAHRIL